MLKQLSIHLEERVYDKLCKIIGKGQISHFIEELVIPYVAGNETDETDRSRDVQSLLWSEAIF